MNQPDPEIEKPNVDTEAIAAADRILNEWRMEDSGELWCPVEEQPRLVHAVTAPLLAALATAEDQEKLWRAEWQQITDTAATLQTKLAAAKAVIKAVERRIQSGEIVPWGVLGEARANYHKTTGPQAENESHAWESHDRAVIEASSVSPGACRICGVHVLDHAGGATGEGS